MLSSYNFNENCKTGSNTKLNQREDTINLTANEKPYSCNNRAISVVILEFLISKQGKSAIQIWGIDS